MSIGTSSAYNYGQFLKMAKNIDAVFARRVEIVAEMCAAEARAMMEDFRRIQENPPSAPPKKGKKTWRPHRRPAGRPLKKGKKGSDRTVGETKEKNGDRMAAAVAYAKAHSGGAPLLTIGAPWTNRTFRAMRGVHSYVDKTPDHVAVGLYHTAWYGAYLEFGNNRKHALIEPIVRQHHKTLLEKLGLLCKG
jgi:hypothetical protein